MEEIYMTKQGYERIQKELEKMKTVDRLEVQRMIGEAKSFGDLSENSEYDAAKTKEAQLETKIIELENQLKYAKIIDESTISTSEVSVGCCVTVYDEEFEEEVEYRIIGENESDPLNGKISNTSPVGSALLGKKVGDIVKVATPGGQSIYKVLKISL